MKTFSRKNPPPHQKKKQKKKHKKFCIVFGIFLMVGAQSLTHTYIYFSNPKMHLRCSLIYRHHLIHCRLLYTYIPTTHSIYCIPLHSQFHPVHDPSLYTLLSHSLPFSLIYYSLSLVSLSSLSLVYVVVLYLCLSP